MSQDATEKPPTLKTPTVKIPAPKPYHPKTDGFSIASIIIKTIKIESKGEKVEKTVNGKLIKIDELHVKADMILTCKWHKPDGKWEESEITTSKTYNHSIGQRVPKKGSPLVFKRITKGGFELI